MMHPVLQIADVTAPGSYELIARAAENREWRILVERLDALDEAFNADPSLHTVTQLEGTMHAIVRARRQTLTEWARENPEDRWALLSIGMSEMYAGMDIRGEHEADAVRESEWQEIMTHFDTARDALHRAMALGGRPGLALYCLGNCAMVAGADDQDHAALVRDVARLDPNWLPAWSSALARSEPRWGGSIEAMEQLVGLAKEYVTVPQFVDMLWADYWWWRANWSATWEPDYETARTQIAHGLALDCHAIRRASLHKLDAQILGTIGAPPADIVAAWQAAVDADPGNGHEFELGRALEQAGDHRGCVAVMETLAGSDDRDALRAANWLGVGYRTGAGHFPVDPAAARRWFEFAATGPDGKTNLAELLLAEDPGSDEAAELLRQAVGDGHDFAAMPLAKHHLDHGNGRAAESVLAECDLSFPKAHYALARGLDEGWFGRADAKAALDVTSTLLPEFFDAWASVLHMTLLSAIGDRDAARAHGQWLKDSIENGDLAIPDPLVAEIDRMLAEIASQANRGLLGRLRGPARLRLQTEQPDLWAA